MCQQCPFNPMTFLETPRPMVLASKIKALGTPKPCDFSQSSHQMHYSIGYPHSCGRHQTWARPAQDPLGFQNLPPLCEASAVQKCCQSPYMAQSSAPPAWSLLQIPTMDLCDPL